MKPIIKVVCGIIWKGDKVLIARRKPGKSLAGYWEFPGGKLNEGEDAEIALKRELKEELGMEVDELKYYGQHIHAYEKFTIELIAYKCRFLHATFEMTDHDEYAFIYTEKFYNFNIAPADLYFFKKLI